MKIVDATHVGVSLDETTDAKMLTDLCEVFGGGAVGSAGKSIPDFATRTSTYLAHPIFNTMRSETSMLRYLRTLSDRDLALDRTMIPLGSCTMKLNATTEMEAVTWPEFSSLHPFAPAKQNAGSRELITQLSDLFFFQKEFQAMQLV